MKNNLFKTTAALLALGALASACTSLAINPDGSGKYRSGVFQKQFSELKYSKNGTNTALSVKGYKSDAAQFVDALEIMKQAYTGNTGK